jgi:hypothetical protein
MKIADLLQSLSDEQVQYVLIGGLAVQLHGFLRSTFDIDWFWQWTTKISFVLLP